MEVFASNEHALLPGFEAEAVAHFQEKLLKVIKQRVFEIGLAHSLLGAEAEELEDVGIADDLSGLEGFCTCVGDGRELGFFWKVRYARKKRLAIWRRSSRTDQLPRMHSIS